MKILGHLSHAWPTQRGGSETAAHATLAWLASRGHDVRCLVMRHTARPVDGVEYAQRGSAGQTEWWEWADVGISQQGSTTNACYLAGDTPVAHWAHNWHYLDGHLAEMRPHDLLAFNSAALQAEQGHLWSGRSMVLHPPTFPDRWHGAGNLVTQVNLSALKGGEMFWELARRMPDVDFLGVAGWGEQTSGHASNVTTIATTQDMAADVYSKTRILIVPTRRVSARQQGESWGMAAAEAAACGIPIVAAPSPGMVEQLGDAAIWCDPDSPDEWEAAIRSLTGAEWVARSVAVQSTVNDPTIELEALEQNLSEMCGALV